MLFGKRRQIEQRRLQRHELEVEARIAGEPAGYRRVMDINERGLRMTTTERLETGDWIPVNLRFSEQNQEVSFLGRVAWTEPGGEIGVDCSKISPERLARLEALIKLALEAEGS